MDTPKFGKHREVYDNYLKVPYKYILTYNGSKTNCYPKFFSWEDAYKIFKEKYPELNEKWNELWLENTPEAKELVKKCNKLVDDIVAEHTAKDRVYDKTLCIIDFLGKNKALIGWRNNNDCKMGMTRVCKIIHKKHGRYLLYKGKEIFIDDSSGWVY